MESEMCMELVLPELDLELFAEFTLWLESPNVGTQLLHGKLYAERPDTVYTMLLLYIRSPSSTTSDYRVRAAKLILRLLDKSGEYFIWPRLHPDKQTQFEYQLLRTLSMETTRPVLEQLQKSVIRLGRILLPQDRWPRLIFFVFKAMVSPSSLVQESGLLIFANLADKIDISLLPPFVTLRLILYCSLTNTEDKYLRCAGLSAAVNLMHQLPPPDREKSQYLLQYMMPVLVEASIVRNQNFTKHVVNKLTHLFTVEPKFSCQHWSDIVGTMLTIADRTYLDDKLRRNALHLVVTLANTRGHEQVMIEQLKPFTAKIVAILLQLLSDIKDMDTEEDNNFKYAKVYSSNISAALGGGLLDRSVVNLLPPYLTDSNWKKRHAALIFLKQISKGCYEAMSRILFDYMSMVEKLSADIHSRVREAAVDVMCVLLVGLKPDLHAQYHYTIMPSLLLAMQKVNWPRVQEEAATVALNLCYCNNDIFKIYFKDLLDASLTMIFRGNRVVQGNMLLILGPLAYLLEDILENDYKNVMQRLKYFLKDAIDNSDRMFSAKLMECNYVIGAFLGEDGFRDDAKEVIKELISLKASFSKADDPAICYMLKAWMNLLKCLGWDLSSKMDLVMSSSPQSAHLVLGAALPSTNLDNTRAKIGKDTGEKLGTEGILLDQKEDIAYDMMCCFADVLGEELYPWIDQVATLLLPLLELKFHEKVRKAAQSAISKLLFSTISRMPDDLTRPYVQLRKLCEKIIPALIEAMHEKYNRGWCGEMLNFLADCIQKYQKETMVKERKNNCKHEVLRLINMHLAKCIITFALKPLRNLLRFLDYLVKS